MMTEAEATERWCPFSRAAIYPQAASGQSRDVISGNRVRDTDLDSMPTIDACRCIASACMAWRETSDVFVRTNVKSGAPDSPPLGGDWDKIVGLGGVEMWQRIEKRGYCGIAGRPE